MDRRTFMMTGACLSSATASAWPWLAHAAARGATVAVVDSTLAYGAAFAGYAAHRRLPVFETGDDIGALWYTSLAPLLRATPAALIGLTRASDYFVLNQLAQSAGHLIEHRQAQRMGSDRRHAHVAFAFAFAPPRALR
jgi:hypothetical protein